ncbi:MAG: hypothetical protein U9N45_01075, partial [Gemmatimonadota bacterium]|nr:hypothetical protein [Gemmatimonadota bacterium]
MAFSQAPAAAPPGPGAGLERAGASLAQGLRLLGLSPAEVTAGFGTATPGESGNRGENLGGLVDSAARLELELSSLPRSPAGVENCLAWSRKFLNLKEIIPRETGTSPAGRERMRQAAASLDSVLPGAGESFTMLVAAERLFHLAFGSLDPVERDELESLVRGFSFQEDQWPGSPVERMCRLAQRVDLAYLWAAAGMCCSAAEGLRQLNPAQTPEFRAGAGWLRSPFRLDTPWGEVIVGTRGRDKYTGTPFLIIDPGGDDSYRLGPDSRGGRKVSMIVDFSGSDTYSGSEGFTPAGSVSGVCWLEDLGGDDRYEGGRFSLGAAALGVGVLVDRLGRDSYVGLELSQGMSFFGLGMLVDLGGDDSYEVSFCGQGACVGGGMGLLMDLDGNDTYTAGGLYPDWRECRGGEPVHTKSYAQGAAGGLRPFLAGGTALLLDCAGNDSYRAGYFGQGAGYWGGTGMLFDLAGDDSYQAARYGQGCGLHRAKGILA